MLTALSPSSPSLHHRPAHAGNAALAAEMLANAPFLQKLGGKLVLLNESNSGLAHRKATQETVTNLLPRYPAMRSWAETVEVTAYELAESFALYYGTGLAAKHLFAPMAKKLASLGEKEAGLLTKNLGDLTEAEVKRILPAKAGMLTATLATATLMGQSAIIYLKNILTAEVFKKSDFSEIVNESHGKPQEEKNKAVIHHSLKRIGQGAALALSLIGVGALTARFGKTGTGPLAKLATKAFKALDFNYGDKGQFGFTMNQIIPFALTAGLFTYPDAARDSLERKEVMLRVGVFLSYLFFGDPILNKLLIEPMRKVHPHLFDGKRLKKLGELTTKGMSQSEFNTILAQKNKALLIPQAIGMFGISMTLSFLNRYLTHRRVEEQQALQRHMTALRPSATHRPSPLPPPNALRPSRNTPQRFNTFSYTPQLNDAQFTPFQPPYRVAGAYPLPYRPSPSTSLTHFNAFSAGASPFAQTSSYQAVPIAGNYSYPEIV